jgi:hypothetical protein
MCRKTEELVHRVLGVRKLIVLGILTGLLFLCIPFADAEAIRGPDSDLALHFAVSAAISEFDVGTAMWLGLGKECYDYCDGGEFSLEDLAADAVGIGWGYAFSKDWTGTPLWESGDWWCFVVGQVLQWGNINWQQAHGFYEMNDLYGEHPSKQKVGWIKAGEIALSYAFCKKYPEHRNVYLKACNIVVYGLMVWDSLHNGVAVQFRW